MISSISVIRDISKPPLLQPKCHALAVLLYAATTFMLTGIFFKKRENSHFGGKVPLFLKLRSPPKVSGYEVRAVMSIGSINKT